ncbi:MULTISPECIES: LLM class flavin-dependent oxidoreductase [unclassified Plantibacter]|jgi:alkanesulfonate monooxygenase SsuD/methylene tetrahydromethanopterin reductase-like flavin-dependent oxidoreductase (luciferase family)|uniref:LLM class flavin-dependent oxidoreductase n=1 Tax=unclassified Plantibacter TaxID=2624265 RepID=UPI003D349DE6
MTKQQHFGWFLSRGFGPHGWGHPYLDWDYRWQEPDLYQQSARELEQAGLDLLIIEDALSLGNEQTLDLRVRGAYGGPKHDPLSLTPFIFQATNELGVVPTVNPLQFPPYQAARQFASLHHLSKNRLGLNVVTDVGSSRHFGVPALQHDGAYDRAEEWLGGVRDLWHSWGPGALIEDRQTGIFADGTKLEPNHHRGTYYDFDGPLSALPFSEGDPIVVSPGSSPRGLAFTGRHSEIQLALAPLDVASIRAYRERVLTAAAATGRTAPPPKILFVFKPIIVGSAEEADRLVAASAHPTDEQLLTVALGWSSDLETDLTGIDLDSHVDPAIFGDHVSRGSINAFLAGSDFATSTLRELLIPKTKLGRISKGEGLVGTADEVADFIELLGDEADNDGLIFAGDLHPVTVHRTLDELVPILRRRGILRREFGGGGLRGNLSDF